MNPGIYFGIATYDGKLHYSTTKGLIEVAMFCGQKRLPFAIDVVPGDAFIGKARDTLVHRFLHNTDWDDFIFIDADIGFSLQGISALMKCPEEIVAGLLPTFARSVARAGRAIAGAMSDPDLPEA